MKILSGPLSMFGAKAEIAAAEKGIAYEREFVPFSLATMYEPKHPDVVRINPKAQVPVLIDDDLEIFDSTQIFEYLEEIKPSPALWPGDAKSRARARLLELRSDEDFFPNCVTLMPAQWEVAGEEGLARAHAAIARYYDEMESLLADTEYLAGALSYADIAFFMASFFAAFLGAPWKPGHARLDAWRSGLMTRDAFKSAADERVAYLEANGIKAPAL